MTEAALLSVSEIYEARGYFYGANFRIFERGVCVGELPRRFAPRNDSKKEKTDAV